MRTRVAQRAARYITRLRGGEGAVREVCDLLLQANQALDQAWGHRYESPELADWSDVSLALGLWRWFDQESDNSQALNGSIYQPSFTAKGLENPALRCQRAPQGRVGHRLRRTLRSVRDERTGTSAYHDPGY